MGLPVRAEQVPRTEVESAMRRRLAEQLREVVRFAPVKPAVLAGLRASIATVLPLVASMVFHFEAGLWLCLGGFNASFADKGGSYRSRASSMSAALLMCALGATLGGLAGGHPALALFVALVWVTACSFAGVYGAAANIVGNTGASTFVISLALPSPTVSEAFERGGAVALGALGAMVLSLVLWPIRPYRPARRAVAECYRSVALYATELALLRGSEASPWQALIQRNHARIREALEVAGSTLAAIRRGRGERQRGEQLLSLFQAVDALFVTLISLGDVLENLGAASWALLEQGQVERTLRSFSEALLVLARGIETEGGVRHVRPPLDWGGEALREALACVGEQGAMLEEAERVKGLHVARLLARLREYVGAAVETATRLSGEPLPPSSQPPRREDPVLGPLRENLTPNSMVLRHALRVGLTTALAVWVSTRFFPSHNYWVTITVLVVMQPYTGSTFLKLLQRVLGTVVGGLLAVLVASWLHNPTALLVLVFFTAATCVAVIPLNYGLYTVFLTLTFVLLAEVGSGDWSLARVRVVNTLVGGALALVGSWVLWERSEGRLLPEQIAASLQANREYLSCLLSPELETGAAPDKLLSEARRKIGLATLNAEASFQRLLSEPRWRMEPLEPLMTLLAYLRRFTAALVALSSTPRETLAPDVRSRLERFAQGVGGVLEDLIDALARERMPSPLPDLDALLSWKSLEAGGGVPGSDEERLLRAQLERVVRQLTVLHGAASRRAAHAPLETVPVPSAP